MNLTIEEIGTTSATLQYEVPADATRLVLERQRDWSGEWGHTRVVDDRLGPAAPLEVGSGETYTVAAGTTEQFGTAAVHGTLDIQGELVLSGGADVGDAIISVNDDGIQPDQTYRWRVVATLLEGSEETSDWVEETTEPIGLETRPVPPSGPYVEIHHPDRDAPLTPTPSDIQKQPTVNGFPRIEITIPYDDRWHSDGLRDADVDVWIDGVKQPIDRVEHRKLEEGDSTKHTVLECRGGLDLENRVIEDEDIVEALPFVESLIEEYTDYEAVVDDPDDVIREDVVVQAAEIVAELQAAFQEIPDDIPLDWDGDTLRPLQTCWVADGEDAGSQSADGGDEFVNGTAGFSGSTIDNYDLWITPEYTIPAGELEIAVRGRREDDDAGAVLYEPVIDGSRSNNDTLVPDPGDDLEWQTISVSDSPELEGGSSYLVELDAVSDEFDPGNNEIDFLAVYDDRYSYTLDNEVHEPEGQLDGPELYPDLVRLEMEEINTPLSITAAYFDVVTDDGLGVPELSIGQDGTDDWVTEQEALSHSLEYDTLAATLLARIGLGRKRDLDAQEETPRFGYEPQRLESVELRADLDETPVLVDFDPDAKLVEVLREVMDIADSVFEVRPGNDDLEVHVTRIDGRPTEVDPDLINYSVDRQTEDTIDRAIIYAAAETIRRLPFEADVDEWTNLPLNEGRIVSGSVTIFDAVDDEEESLERGEDYEIRRNREDGPPQIKLLTNVAEPRLECDFKPRGDYTREGVDEADADTDVFDAPELNSQQMADIAAFQAVEGAYTLEVIEAEITVPLNAIGWELADALNVVGLPGDDAFQVLEEGTDPSQGVFRLGAGKTGDEVVSEIRHRTQRVSQRV